jgi:predicted transcriptional regulator
MMKDAMSAIREKFSSQASPEVLSAFRQLAENEGRQFQALLDEAMRDYLDRKSQRQSRRHVLEAFSQSRKEFEPLYRELAK